MSQDDLHLPDDVEQLKAMIAGRDEAIAGQAVAIAERDEAIAGPGRPLRLPNVMKRSPGRPLRLPNVMKRSLSTKRSSPRSTRPSSSSFGNWKVCSSNSLACFANSMARRNNGSTPIS